MLITNISSNNFNSLLRSRLKSVSAIDICVGFCGKSAIDDYYDEFVRISTKGRCRIVLGMYSHEGAFGKRYSKLKDVLLKLNRDLQNKDIFGSGVFITTTDYHGKIYNLEFEDHQEIYVGSCNFSKDGLLTRREAEITVPQSEFQSIVKYIDDLSSSNNSILIDKLKITQQPQITGLAKLTKLKSLPSNLNSDKVSGKITLRVDEQPKSGLNLCFSSGRKDNKGFYKPRPWYEVELSVDENERNQPVYPKIPNSVVTIKGQKTNNRCVFNALLHYRNSKDYLQCTMATYSDHNKAMCSDSNRHILGEFIKSRLEKMNLISVGDLITSDVLSQYGSDYIEIERFTDTNIPQNPNDPLANKVFVLTF